VIEVIEKSLDNTFSIIISAVIVILFILSLLSWAYLPFAIFSIKRELKKIRELLEKQNKISLD